MPNRMLKDWTMSDKVNSITVHSERFFTRLIMKADDYGCFYADPRLLKANLFPFLIDTIREADISRWMAECQKAGLIVLYESNQKSFLQIVDFGQRLRQKVQKFPLPDTENSMTATCQHDVSTLPHEGKGSRIEGEEEVEPPPPDQRELKLFEMFKRAAQGFDDSFLKSQVLKFINKYPGCIAAQSGGLVNSWAANLNKAEQQKWKDQVKTEHQTTNGLTAREKRDAEMLASL